MNRLVHIVLSDRGWILERLANEIAKRLSYVRFDTLPDASSPIQYYITYGCRKERVSPVEVALFTHQEQDPATAGRFLTAARDVDAAIAMSKATGRILADASIANTVISPGVDLDRFAPTLKIAVVGRTYHTGRKGEALVNAVMDIPGIEWHFTGEGWPGPALKLTDEELPAFYRSMDYILVPATNEGGPMCVLEALASGVPVIGSNTGWVQDFPHIPFDNGDAQSLRAVLCGLREKKFALRGAVSGMTWDAWAEGHDALFRRLATERNLVPTSAPVSCRRVRSVALLSHGLESTVIGGPSVRIPRTAQALRQKDIEAAAIRYPTVDLPRYDLVHAYNVWPPVSAVRIARRAATLGKPFVFSPIMLDLSEAGLWQADILRVFRSATSPEHAEAAMAWARARQAMRAEDGLRGEPEPGYLDALRELAETADAFVFLGERERALTATLVPSLPEVSRIVRNPVDAALFSCGDPDLFRSAYGLKDYVLCVARIEHRKNQLLLALALRDTGIPLVLIGHPGDEEYLRLVKSFGGPNLLIIDRLEPGSEMLRSAIAGARVFTLPSWAEGAPLAALEAGAAGARMVLSDRSSEREYFGDRALYCDPADPASIREAILEAWEGGWSDGDREALKDHVARSFSWDVHTTAVTDVYEEVAARRAAGIRPPGTARVAPLPVPVHDGKATEATGEVQAPLEIVFDLTTLANNATTRSGIVRVERSMATALLATEGVRVRFVVWRSVEVGFVEIPQTIVARDLLSAYLQATTVFPIEKGTFRPGSRFVVVGSSWMQNASYVHFLSTFAIEHRLELSVLMHDLTPVLFPHWFLDGYSGRFTANLNTLLQTTDRLLAYSDNTRADLEALALETDLDLCSIGKFRLADAIGIFAMEMSEKGRAIQAKFSKVPFILATGGIHARKNYGLLYDVWTMLRTTMGDRCPHLVIAGGVLWNGGEMARTIQEDRLVNRHIHILNDVDDALLDWLYRTCLFTVYPSLYEGWGLPVGESLSYGKICVASNRSSVPEIAPTLTDLLDPLDRKLWAAVIQHYATSKSTRDAKEARIRDEYVPTSWMDTVAGMLKALAKPLVPARRDLYTLGDLVLFTAEEPVPRYRHGGWFQRESWGAWASSRTAGIRVVLTAKPDEDLILTVIAKHFSKANRTDRCSVVANGVKVADWDFQSATGRSGWPYAAGKALIPKGLVDDDGQIVIELTAMERYKVSEVVANSEDHRLLGLGVTGFSLQAVSATTNSLDLLATRNELRCALGAPPTLNLAQAFRLSAARPAYPVNRSWMAVMPDDAKLAVDASTVHFDGFRSQRGSLRLRGGVIDLSAQSDTVLEAAIVAGVSAGESLVISVLVNDEFVDSWTIETDAPSSRRMLLPMAVLLKRDPAEIVFLSTRMIGKQEAGPGEFVIAQIRLDQPVPKAQRNIPELPSGRGVVLSPANAAVQQAFMPWGWYAAEEQGVWSIGDLGRFDCTVTIGEGRNEILLLNVAALSTGKPDDTATIAVEGTDIAVPVDLTAPNVGVVSRIVPLGLGSALPQGSKEITIAFRRNAATSPQRLGMSGDRRLLGLRVAEVELRRLATLPEKAFLAASDEALEQVALFPNWHVREALGRWTSGERGDIWIAMPTDMRPGSHMTLRCAAVSPGQQGQARVDVLIDDVVVTSRTMSHMDVQAIPVELPPGTGRAGSLMKVSLVTDSTLVPQDAGLGSDFRCLGVLLVGIEWHQPAAAAQHNGVHNNGTQPKAESEAVLEVLSEIRSEANGEDSEKDGAMAARSAKKPRAAGWKAAPSPAKRPSVSEAGQTT
ncbi:glycosyltransferase [Azospirillum brasilense]|nr:glycosyltransferase [Azospirillum brasilense]